VTKKGEITHSGSGNTVPSVYVQGYDYAKMGYTTVLKQLYLNGSPAIPMKRCVPHPSWIWVGILFWEITGS